MIHYVNGDNASYKDLWNGWIGSSPLNETCFFFSTKRKWFAKVAPSAFIVGLGFSLIMLLALIIVELLHGRFDSLGLMFSLSPIPLVFTLIIMLPATYIDSFFRPQKVTKKVDNFIAKYLPDAVVVASDWPSYREIEWKGVPFAVCHYTVREPNRFKLLRSRELMDVMMWYSTEKETSPFNDKGEFSEEFLESTRAFCDGKPDCRDIQIDGQTMFLQINMKELKRSGRDVGASLDMLIYLAQRFHLFPIANWKVPLNGMAVRHWMDVVLKEDAMPEGVKTLWVHVTQEEKKYYFVEMRFASHFDAETTEWMSSEEWIFGKRLYGFGDARSWDKVLAILTWSIFLCLAQKFDLNELPTIEGLFVHYANEDKTLRYTRQDIITCVEAEYEKETGKKQQES